MRSQARVWLLMVVCGLLLAAVVPAAAQGAEEPKPAKFVAVNCEEKECAQHPTTINLGPPFGVQEYIEPEAPEPKEAEEEGYLQAGGRVPFGITDFKVETEGSLPTEKPKAKIKHIRTDVAPGLATDPFAVPRCTLANFGGEAFPGSHLYPAPNCAGSEIGENKATIYVPSAGVDLALSGTAYDLEQENGLASEFGVALKLPEAISAGGLKEYFEFLEAHGIPVPTEEEQEEAEEGEYFAHTLIKGNVEWGRQSNGTHQGDFHDYFEIDTSTELPIIASRLIFEGRSGEGDFITNATSCPGHNTTTLKLTDEENVTGEGEYTTPVGLKGCFGEPGFERLPFAPSFAMTPATTVTEQPNEFTAVASETHNPTATDQSQVKSAVLTLPEGMTLNPSAASGLTACTEAQAHQEGTVFGPQFGVECPASSKIGTVVLEAPTLGKEQLTGGVFLGAPNTGTITGPPYKIYVVANNARYGVSVRLLGETFPDETTGQVKTYFKNPPEQPFTNLSIHFERGVLAPVANPLVCGNPQGVVSFEPTSEPGTTHGDPFGESVTGCASTPPPFNPAQSTANSNGNGGASTSFTLNLARNDGEQYIGTDRTELPPGLVGKIPAAERCSASAAESETVACPAGSQIGTATVLAGSGSQPFKFTGPVYLTNSVKGYPYGLSIKVPAVAGPFNLGTVVTVAGITVDPYTSQVIVESAIPRIRSGIPLRIRNISVAVNKSGFMINPTNCGALQTVSTLGGFTLTGGPLTASKAVPTGFQVGNCSKLKFAPKFTAKSNAKTSRVNGALISTTITQGSGQANIKSVKVQLPRALPSRLTTLQKACTEAVFNANPFKCPSGAFVGGATVKTPTLPTPLKGPAIFVSHGGAAFPDLDLVLEDANHLRVILVGNTNIKNSITTTTFASTPDVPISSVTVTLPTGSHSAVAAFGSLCAKNLVMPTTITSQNGKTYKHNTVISVAGCGVQVVGRKVAGHTLYLTVRAPAAGRISASGRGLKKVYKRSTRAHQLVTLKVPLSSGGLTRHKPFKVSVRVGFVPRKGHNSVAHTKVTFR